MEHAPVARVRFGDAGPTIAVAEQKSRLGLAATRGDSWNLLMTNQQVTHSCNLLISAEHADGLAIIARISI